MASQSGSGPQLTTSQGMGTSDPLPQGPEFCKPEWVWRRILLQSLRLRTWPSEHPDFGLKRPQRETPSKPT